MYQACTMSVTYRYLVQGATEYGLLRYLVQGALLGTGRLRYLVQGPTEYWAPLVLATGRVTEHRASGTWYRARY